MPDKSGLDADGEIITTGRRGAPHRDATRLGKRTRQSENDRSAAGTRAGGKQESRGEESPAPAHERGKVKAANGIAQYPRAFHITCMDPIRRLCGFAAGLERLLAARDAAELEAIWSEQNLGQVGWEALALARRANTEALEPALGRSRAPHGHRRHAGPTRPPLFRVSRARRAPPARGVAAVREILADAGSPSCVRRGRR